MINYESLVKYGKFAGRILKHKFWVGAYCFKAGLYWQAIAHDLSKFSPTEFISSAEYFVKGQSPITIEKAEKGYSLAWLHHRGHNPHHYDYWIDKLDDGGTPLLMPYKYATELICDYLGACRVYESSSDFSYQKELDFWNQRKDKLKMHPAIKYYVSSMFERMVATNSCECLKDSYQYYQHALEMHQADNE